MNSLETLKLIAEGNMLVASIHNIKNLLHLDSEEEAKDLADQDLMTFAGVAQNLCEDPNTLCAAMANYGFIGGLKHNMEEDKP